MKTFRMVVALAVMVVIVGAAGPARAAAQMGRQADAVGMTKGADKAAAKSAPRQKKQAAKQEQVQGKAGKDAADPADKAAVRKAKGARKKAEGDKPLEAGKNTASRKKSA